MDEDLLNELKQKEIWADKLIKEKEEKIVQIEALCESHNCTECNIAQIILGLLRGS